MRYNVRKRPWNRLPAAMSGRKHCVCNNRAKVDDHLPKVHLDLLRILMDVREEKTIE